MKHFTNILLLVSATLIIGCASDFQSTGSGSSSTYDSSVTANDPPPSVSAPDTSIQDSIDRMNQQMAMDAANAAATQQNNDAMAAAQQTMNNANNQDRPVSNW